MKSHACVLALVMILSIGAFANDEPKVKVISVIDGNTIEVLDNAGERYKILLFGIDSPDSGQNFANEAKHLLTKLVHEKHVILVMHGKDRHGNHIAEIQGQDIPDPRYELVRSGLAWTTEQDEQLELLKQHARAQGLGLWVDENPMPPWLWRRQQSMAKSKSN